MTVAPAAIPPLAPGEPPLAFLVDYDGTIAQTDVTGVLLYRFVADHVDELVAAWRSGVGSREIMAREVALLPPVPEEIAEVAAAQPHDPTFRAFAEHARDAGIPIEVVSDGFGFFIEPALARLGVPWVPVATAQTRFGAGGATIDYPFGHPVCRECGTCKRERVRAYQASGRAVVFIGDGESDRYAAGYADQVFAKRALVAICEASGWPFRRWTAFSEIDAWLGERLAAFVADPSSLPGPLARPLFCGVEAWGLPQAPGAARSGA